MDYQAPLKAKSISVSLPSRFRMPKSKVTHEGVEVVELFSEHMDIPRKGRFSFAFHLKKIKECGINVYHAERIIEIMLARKTWVKNQSGEEMQCGRWLTNRYKEIKQIGPERFVSKNS
jgi:hypothetical protein